MGGGGDDKPGAKVYDPIALNSIWREHIKKERGVLKLNEEFRLNPHALAVSLPQPPHGCTRPDALPPGSSRALSLREQGAQCDDRVAHISHCTYPLVFLPLPTAATAWPRGGRVRERPGAGVRSA